MARTRNQAFSTQVAKNAVYGGALGGWIGGSLVRGYHRSGVTALASDGFDTISKEQHRYNLAHAAAIPVTVGGLKFFSALTQKATLLFLGEELAKKTLSQAVIGSVSGAAASVSSDLAIGAIAGKTEISPEKAASFALAGATLPWIRRLLPWQNLLESPQLNRGTLSALHEGRSVFDPELGKQVINMGSPVVESGVLLGSAVTDTALFLAVDQTLRPKPAANTEPHTPSLSELAASRLAFGIWARTLGGLRWRGFANQPLPLKTEAAQRPEVLALKPASQGTLTPAPSKVPASVPSRRPLPLSTGQKWAASLTAFLGVGGYSLEVFASVGTETSSGDPSMWGPVSLAIAGILSLANFREHSMERIFEEFCQRHGLARALNIDTDSTQDIASLRALLEQADSLLAKIEINAKRLQTPEEILSKEKVQWLRYAAGQREVDFAQQKGWPARVPVRRLEDLITNLEKLHQSYAKRVENMEKLHLIDEFLERTIGMTRGTPPYKSVEGVLQKLEKGMSKEELTKHLVKLSEKVQALRAKQSSKGKVVSLNRNTDLQRIVDLFTANPQASWEAIEHALDQALEAALRADTDLVTESDPISKTENTRPQATGPRLVQEPKAPAAGPLMAAEGLAALIRNPELREQFMRLLPRELRNMTLEGVLRLANRHRTQARFQPITEEQIASIVFHRGEIPGASVATVSAENIGHGISYQGLGDAKQHAVAAIGYQSLGNILHDNTLNPRMKLNQALQRAHKHSAIFYSSPTGSGNRETLVAAKGRGNWIHVRPQAGNHPGLSIIQQGNGRAGVQAIENVQKGDFIVLLSGPASPRVFRDAPHEDSIDLSYHLRDQLYDKQGKGPQAIVLEIN